MIFLKVKAANLPRPQPRQTLLELDSGTPIDLSGSVISMRVMKQKEDIWMVEIRLHPTTPRSGHN